MRALDAKSPQPGKVPRYPDVAKAAQQVHLDAMADILMGQPSPNLIDFHDLHEAIDEVVQWCQQCGGGKAAAPVYKWYGPYTAKRAAADLQNRR